MEDDEATVCLKAGRDRPLHAPIVEHVDILVANLAGGTSGPEATGAPARAPAREGTTGARFSDAI